ncbi:MAG: lysophospholipid acyltransferase family protein [Chitinophagales bacterium]
MSQILFYLIIKPLSLLPIGVLLRISDFMYLILYYVVGYRKKVVFANLQNSFPNKSLKEIKIIQKQFYQHLCDLVVESIRIFSISKEEIIKRCKVVNPEIFDEYYQRGQSILVTAGHYNNWEMMAVGCNPQIPHQMMGIYSSLSNPFFDKKMKDSRAKFGIDLVAKKEVKAYFADNASRPTASFFGTDQSPPSGKRAHWMEFLNQDTAVLFGTEKYAKEYNCPVLFGYIKKVKRGYYEMEYVTVEDEPLQTAKGEITEKHTRLLEEEIKNLPQYWLWTHKRWKRKRSDP